MRVRQEIELTAATFPGQLKTTSQHSRAKLAVSVSLTRLFFVSLAKCASTGRSVPGLLSESSTGVYSLPSPLRWLHSALRVKTCTLVLIHKLRMAQSSNLTHIGEAILERQASLGEALAQFPNLLFAAI